MSLARDDFLFDPSRRGCGIHISHRGSASTPARHRQAPFRRSAINPRSSSKPNSAGTPETQQTRTKPCHQIRRVSAEGCSRLTAFTTIPPAGLAFERRRLKLKWLSNDLGKQELKQLSPYCHRIAGHDGEGVALKLSGRPASNSQRDEAQQVLPDNQKS
jgi:hypothetical protein